ncbi:hypothetical protein [Exiguobacterium sp. s155]|uniref:hypothetical protein n=1 Tax=Exiguobacterium sp. s155 TaxID=2751286 RepID=UPI001BE98FCB|nr:hypothetical protein [Exiguobacterium sp. s155]
MSRQKKYMRRASKEELTWIYKRLSTSLERNDVIFSVEKILKGRVLLHVSCDGDLCSVYFNFMTGRFSRPIDLPVPEKDIAQ